MKTKLKFLVDVSVGKKVEEFLSDEKYDFKSVRNIDMRMEDVDILKIAANENRMVITMDKDFGELVYNSGKAHKGVLLLRLENESGAEKIKIIETIFNKYYNELENNFCVYQKGKFRIKK